MGSAVSRLCNGTCANAQTESRGLALQMRSGLRTHLAVHSCRERLVIHHAVRNEGDTNPKRQRGGTILIAMIPPR